MREIKFRAFNFRDFKMEYFPLGETIPYDYDGYDRKRNYPVMQFTGLKDKNGVEIYEGDIVIFGGVYNYEVVFIKGGFAVMFKDGHRYLGQFAEIEIIGNIYENPNLLKTIMYNYE